MALIPFRKSLAENTDIKFSRPIKLPACSSTATISMQIKNLFIPNSLVLQKRPKNSSLMNSLIRHNIESIHAGLALALLDLIASSPRIQEKMIADFHKKLLKAVENYEQQVIARKPDVPVAPIRVQGILLVNRCLLFAEQIFRSAAFAESHSLYRLHNEVMLSAFHISHKNNLILKIE